jgi:hypothetical protein
MPVIVSVQPEFGQSGAPGTGEVGGLVVTLNEALPFLTAPAGTAPDPLAEKLGFCPGTLLEPPGLVQRREAVPLPSSLTTMFPLPSPARAPLALSVSADLSAAKTGLPCLKWALAASPVAAVMAKIASALRIMSVRRMFGSLLIF